jgi:hypothetical protein
LYTILFRFLHLLNHPSVALNFTLSIVLASYSAFWRIKGPLIETFFSRTLLNQILMLTQLDYPSPIVLCSDPCSHC